VLLCLFHGLLACLKARQDAEELAALKAFALELKAITG